MKRFVRLWRFAILGLAAFAATAAETGSTSGVPALPASETGPVLALVTFTDRSLGRAPVGSPGEIYVPGMDYRSTAWSQRLAGRIARDHGLRTVTEWPVLTLGVHCVVYAVDDGRPLVDVVKALAGDRRVTKVYPMNAFRTMTNTARPNDPYRPLQKTVHGMNLDIAHRFATGRGITIAVVDTGVDGAHRDLSGQIAQSRDLITDTTTVSVAEEHGTAVAGVIAALADNHQGIVGVAPAAHLVTLRACWASAPGSVDGTCNTLTLAKALDTAIRMHARVINLSLSGPRDELLEVLAQTAIANGATLVGAMPVGIRPEDAFPTSVPGVIRVDVAGVETGPAPAISAPGTEIFTTLPHDSYGFMSGSSIAAAHVSGVIALLLEIAPQLESTRIKDILEQSQDAGRGRSTQFSGLDACRAIARVNGAIDCRASRPDPAAAAAVRHGARVTTDS